MYRLLARPGRACWLVFAVTVTALAHGSPALAHSTLVATEPPRDAVVEHSPDRVVLRFDERVETALGSIRVYDGAGRRVDMERITRPNRSRSPSGSTASCSGGRTPSLGA